MCIFSPTCHQCCGGPPGHQGSHPGCSPRGAGPRAGWVSLAQSSILYPSAGTLTAQVPTVKTDPNKLHINHVLTNITTTTTTRGKHRGQQYYLHNICHPKMNLSTKRNKNKTKTKTNKKAKSHINCEQSFYSFHIVTVLKPKRMRKGLNRNVCIYMYTPTHRYIPVELAINLSQINSYIVKVFIPPSTN